MADHKDIKFVNGKLCISTGELESILNISRQTLSDWKKQGCPNETRGFWDIAEVLRWRGLVANDGVKTEERAAVQNLFTQKQELEVKLKEAQLESIGLKNAIARGDYIEKTEIRSVLQRLFVVLKTSLMTLSKTIAIELMKNNIEINLTRLIEIKIQNIMIDALENIAIDGVFKPPKTKKKLA